MATSTRVELTLRGFRGEVPVSRTAGAGPSADGHLVIDGLNAAIPLNPNSPFVFDGSRILLDDQDTGLDVQLIRRPRFYDLTTANGVPYENWPGYTDATCSLPPSCKPVSATRQISGAGFAPSRSRCDPVAPRR